MHHDDLASYPARFVGIFISAQKLTGYPVDEGTVFVVDELRSSPYLDVLPGVPGIRDANRDTRIPLEVPDLVSPGRSANPKNVLVEHDSHRYDREPAIG